MALADDNEFLRNLAGQLEEIELPAVQDVTKLPDHELSLAVAECDRQLEEMGELYAPVPRTEQAREVHSRRGALLIEMSRRGLR